MYTLFCDHCAEGLTPFEVCPVEHLPVNIDSANIGESAQLCNSCYDTLGISDWLEVAVMDYIKQKVYIYQINRGSEDQEHWSDEDITDWLSVHTNHSMDNCYWMVGNPTIEVERVTLGAVH